MERHFAHYVSQTVDQQITDAGLGVGNLFDILCCPQGSLGLDRIDDAVREHVASNFRVQIHDMDIRFCRIATWIPGTFLVLFALMSFLSSRKQNQIIETQQLIL